MQASQAYVLEELPAPPVEQRRRLGSVAEHLASRTANLLIRDSDGSEQPLPEALVRVLLSLLQAGADGRTVLVVGHDTQVSPQVAAEWLGVSRPFVYRLIERGDLRADRVGAHYRLRARDVLDLADRRAQLASSIDQGFATALGSGVPGQARDPDPKSAWQAMDVTRQAAALERVRRRAAGRRGQA